MSIKDTVHKAAGLLFEFEPAPDAPSAPVVKPRTVEEILKDTPGPNLDEIKAPAAAPVEEPAEPVIGANGKINFESIYKMAKLPDTPLTAEQVLDLLASFPADLPMESKRTTLKITIGAMGKTTGASQESVVADTSRKLAALSAFHDSYGAQADKYCALATTEIQNLEAQIATKKEAMADATARKQMVHDACTKESDRLDDVLEFFSLDVAPSKLAP